MAAILRGQDQIQLTITFNNLYFITLFHIFFIIENLHICHGTPERAIQTALFPEFRNVNLVLPCLSKERLLCGGSPDSMMAHIISGFSLSPFIR